MPGNEQDVSELHERTLNGVQKVIDRAMNYVTGLEKIVVSRAVQILQPRVEQRIRQAPESDLLAELRYLHDLLGDILQEPVSKKPAKGKAKRKRLAKRA